MGCWSWHCSEDPAVDLGGVSFVIFPAASTDHNRYMRGVQILGWDSNCTSIESSCLFISEPCPALVEDVRETCSMVN